MSITLDANIPLYAEGFPFKFPSGEMQIRLSEDLILHLKTEFYVDLVFNFESNDDIMTLLLTVSAIRELYQECTIFLNIPYVPYSRQDRVMVPGESLSVKVFAAIVNSLNLSRVTIIDPHSDVTTALFDKVIVKTQAECVKSAVPVTQHVDTLLCPDSGARKKTLEVAKALGIKTIIYADKTRDVDTGHIAGTRVDLSTLPNQSLKGRNILLVDDICEGGRTFTEIAKALGPKEDFKLSLYVTHGFFSKGMDELNNMFDNVYCFNLKNRRLQK